ncbi:MAG TPA: hypothetical protein PKD99_13830 [Sphingopyxis sp.]|nr:hypothetical protein [Sphingopyxis sp.]HMP46176.1 hypothetical protein [Sphingopyxis sp.]HMQ20542.1 hypothetical protein [Sphingopyxis sp.]
MQGEPPMRFSPLVPPRRPLFGRRSPHAGEPGLAGPDAEERRLIDRLLRRAGYRDSR